MPEKYTIHNSENTTFTKIIEFCSLPGLQYLVKIFMAGKSLAPTALAFLPGTTASALVRFQPRALSVAFSSGSPMTVLPPPDDDDGCADSSVTIASE